MPRVWYVCCELSAVCETSVDQQMLYSSWLFYHVEAVVVTLCQYFPVVAVNVFWVIIVTVVVFADIVRMVIMSAWASEWAGAVGAWFSRDSRFQFYLPLIAVVLMSSLGFVFAMTIALHTLQLPLPCWSAKIPVMINSCGMFHFFVTCHKFPSFWFLTFNLCRSTQQSLNAFWISQIDLDLDRFVGRDQSDHTKKNVFNTAAKFEKPRYMQHHYKIS